VQSAGARYKGALFQITFRHYLHTETLKTFSQVFFKLWYDGHLFAHQFGDRLTCKVVAGWTKSACGQNKFGPVPSPSQDFYHLGLIIANL